MLNQKSGSNRSLKIRLNSFILILISLIVLGGTDDTILARRQLYIIFVYLVYILYLSVKSRRGFLKIDKTCFALYALLFAIHAGGLFYSIDLVLTVRFTIYLLIYMICRECLLTQEDYRFFLTSIQAISFLLSLSIILSAILGNHFVNMFSFWLTNRERVLLDIRYGQYSGLVGDRAFASMAMFTGIVAMMGRFIAFKRIRSFEIVESISMLIALFLTGKRITLLMITCCLIVSVFITGSQKARLSVIRMIGIGAIAILVSYFFVPRAQIILSRFILALGDTSYNGRTQFWNIGIFMFRQKPLLGWGMGSFVEYNRIFGTGIRQYAHNMYIQMLAETGIIGFSMYTVFFAYNLYLVIKRIKNGPPNDPFFLHILFFSLFIQLGFLIYGMTGYPYYNLQQGVLYFIVCGVPYVKMFKSAS